MFWVGGGVEGGGFFISLKIKKQKAKGL